MAASAPARLVGRIDLSATGWGAVAGVWFVAVMLLAILGRGPIAVLGLIVLSLGAGGVIAALLLAARLEARDRRGRPTSPFAAGDRG